jgi:hypothetical protein
MLPRNLYQGVPEAKVESPVYASLSSVNEHLDAGGHVDRHPRASKSIMDGQLNWHPE